MKIFVLQMQEAFSKAEAKLPKGKKTLSESQILDALEKVCTDKFER